MKFLKELYRRNPILAYTTLFFAILFGIFLVAYQLCQYKLTEICYWLKPGKFAASLGIYTATLAWYLEYLKATIGKKRIKVLSGAIALLAVVEILGIIIQSWLASPNPYRLLIPSDAVAWLSKAIYLAGNVLITITTLITCYITLLFFRPIPLQPTPYLWGIRAGFVAFIFSAALGGFLASYYGQVPPDASHFGIPFSRFSSKRDVLITIHFIGIHILQILPLCCFYFHKYIKKGLILTSVGLYCLVTIYFISQVNK